MRRAVFAVGAAATFFAAIAACVGSDPDSGAVPATPDSGSPTGDGSSTGDSSSTNDAGTDAAATCHDEDPFGTPSEIAGLAASAPVHVRLTADEREIYFQNTLVQRLMVARRADATVGFDPPQFLDTTIVDAGTNGYDPTVSADGLVLVFQNGKQLARMTRPDRQSAFGAAQVIGPHDPSSNEEDPHLLGDKSAIYFVRRALDGGTFSVWRSASGPAGFETPAQVTLPADATNPSSTDDELTMYFTSASRIHRATRATAATTFGTSSVVDELSIANLDAGDADRPGWLSPDRCRMYFVSGGLTNSKAYLATRKPR